jgi:PPOX class probable F420-dependent enzyme
MPTIPDEFLDLFEKPTFAHVVTMMPDGRPHTTPVWIDYDVEDNRLLVNTERHRRKARNVDENPAVSVSMTDPEDPYRYLSVTGTVEETTTEGAREHADELAQRYIDDDYPSEIQTERLLLRIKPEDIYHN